MKLRRLLACLLLAASAFAADAPLMPQSPSLSRTHIAFALGNNLFVVPREGGEARRLVAADPGVARGPVFSPDGSLVAFSGEFDGNLDVYVVPATGGELKRLTSHPGSDSALGWTPDGKSVLIRSRRGSYSRFDMLYTVPAGGGFPAEVPLPMGVQGSYSADAAQLAYVPTWNLANSLGDHIAIKNYRGGKFASIWIARLSDSEITKVPRTDSNDFNPMWVGDKVYFLSDRAGAITLFSYDTKSRAVRQLIKNDGFDLKAAAAGPDAIVYEQFGGLHLYDLASGRTRPVPLRVAADFPQVRPRLEKIAAAQLRNADLSPTGARAVFEAHGEILTVPAEKGDARNLTRTTAVAERDPAWSPDGKWLAYFSDASGEYTLHLRDQTGLGAARVIALGEPPSFFYNLAWSPDSKRVAYSDKRGHMWHLEIEAAKPVKFDTDIAQRGARLVWSADSRWLTYDKELPNNLSAIFVHSIETGVTTQVTDGMSDAAFPNFDRSGKYLYFTASTDVGLTSGGSSMSRIGRPVTRAVYLAVLRKDLPSPLAPESDEEKDEAKDKEKKPDEVKAADAEKTADPDATKSDAKPADVAAKKKESGPAKVTIDFDGLGQRILALPLPERNYGQLAAGKEGILYVIEGPQISGTGAGKNVLQRFDLKTRKTEKILDAVDQFTLAAKGDKMLWRAENKWFIAAADKAPKAGDGALKLDSLEVEVDPRAEWRQMFREVWRIQRDFFYDPNHHGMDLALLEKTYAPFLDGLASRADLNYLFAEMLGNLSVQHLYVSGGTKPETKTVPVGLLGADYRIAEGRYQFARVFDGENWNPQAKAPLTQPGVNVKAGDFLLAVNGRDLTAGDEVYSFFLGTAGKQTVLRVGPNADGSGARDVTLVPVASEASLRNLAWIEGNRRKVDELSGGKLAYIYVPDTAVGGYTSFNRYFFAQSGKQGAVIDERFNGGGWLADYIIELLQRRMLSASTTREGNFVPMPVAAIFGPKAMIVNEFAGSGGDALPWYFKKTGLGPVIGTRTWGGLIGIGGYPVLMDGGTVTAPHWGIFGLDGQWEMENHGLAPDIEVELDPKLVRQGRDPQLERAVAVVLEALAKSPPVTPRVPEFPKFTPRIPMQR